MSDGLLAAARVGDAIEHDSIWSQVAEVVGTLAAGVAIGAAIGFAVGTGGMGLVVGAVVGGLATAAVDGVLGWFGTSIDKIADGVGKALGEAVATIAPPSKAGYITDGSTNVFINSKPLARATFVPPHPGQFEGNRVLCENHSPNQAMAEGSEIVLVNGVPASRQGDLTNCEARVSEGSPDVFIGGTKQQTQPIESSKPWWLTKGAQWLGLALTLCRGKWKDIPGKLACLGMGMAVSAVTDTVISAVFGKPVHGASGIKFLDGSDDEDFALPARLPLRWARTYNSLDQAEGPLGPGWRLPIGVTLTARLGDGLGLSATVTAADGVEMPFGPIGPGESVGNALYGWTLGRTRLDRWVAQDPDGLYYDFGPDEAGEALPLQRLEDRNGNAVVLHRDEAGRLSELYDDAERHYLCRYDDRHPGRIAEVAWVRTPEDQVVLVRYGYDATGRLESVTNGASELVRRFTWHREGPGRGLMASHTLPSGLVSHYEWAAAGSHPRVVRHWSSDGQAWAAEYAIEADGGSGTTRVTDHLGRVQEWAWQGSYQITRYTDALGRSWHWQYDSAGQPVECEEPDGARWLTAYDERGRVVATVDPLGRADTTRWRLDLDLPEQETAADGGVTRYKYDLRGNLLAVEHPGGRVEVERDDRGSVVRHRDERGGESQWTVRDDGQPSSYTDCSGKTTRWVYDAPGRLLAERDAAGGTSRYGWDEANRLTEATAADGVRQSWRWRPGGLLAETDRAGSVTRYQWDEAGRLLAETDPVGSVVRHGYDPAGRLEWLSDGLGQVTRFDYDRADRLVAETGIDGVRTEYALDDRDLPVVVARGSGGLDATVLELARDRLGRLVEKRTAEAVTRYAYDAGGRITRMQRFAEDGETEVDAVGFAYDPAGSVVEETATIHRLGRLVDGQWRWEALPGPRSTAVHHRRDPLGNTLATALPHGPELRYHRYGSGHLLQISLGTTAVSELERDDLHREVWRSQGRLSSRYGLDPVGHRLWQQVGPRDPVRSWGAGVAEFTKQYRYNGQGLLARRQDGWQGERQFGYDPAARLVSNRGLPPGLVPGATASPPDEGFLWDGASNAVPHDRSFGVVSGSVVQNRVLRWEDGTWRYDSHGRLAAKDTPAGGKQSFAWNSEHQMVGASTSTAGQWSYHYDALGRRIAKQRRDGRHLPVWFLWDGMRQVQEESGDRVVTTVYEDADSYVPLARVEQKLGDREIAPEQIWYVHADVNGAPEELTTHAGKVAWRARYRSWGNLALEEWDAAEAEGDDGQRRDQPLRYQGQYRDAETGLHYNTFRYYDPEIGRFTNQDPIGLLGGLNLYQYAPDPISWLDPWGWSARLNCMGKTPGKNSKTGRDVQDRMRAEGTLVGTGNSAQYKASDKKWYPLSTADMAHRTDAVSHWNSEGGFFGAKSPEIRGWMRDPNNYVLDHYSLNRSAGAKLGQTYRDPSTFAGPAQAQKYK